MRPCGRTSWSYVLRGASLLRFGGRQLFSRGDHVIAGCRHVLVAPPYCGLGVGSEAIEVIAGRRHVLAAPPYCGLGVGIYMYIFTMVVAATPVYVYYHFFNIYIYSGAGVDRVV
jgi:hypothetical protein